MLVRSVTRSHHGAVSLSFSVYCRRPAALDRRVVVELAALLRLRDELVHADEAAVERLEVGRAHLRIDDALPRVRVIRRGELALRPLKPDRR
jgi:hypothetical protein